jgi:UDP-N-acetylglucosamine 4-epimerase
MIRNQDVIINGDGETSRDFCYIANAVQANLLAALAPDPVQGEVFNVAVNGRTSLNALFAKLREALRSVGIRYDREPIHAEFRPGDVRHSQADITKAERLLGYAPTHRIEAGLGETARWARGFFTRNDIEMQGR